MQKLLRKTSKEIYKLRKTKVEKNKPDMISFKEKMAFFTRRGASSVPEIPASSTSGINPSPSEQQISEEETKKTFNYNLNRDGVEV
ncbi:CLUMA_CG005998, isoform A [Clunio marinus]|uniref:CLUMA_CG005998, isoform A n=1 Tax=Clunio marinus TaxID=568069 RepID=A0A1J1I0S2_9DIPT|nr:CLUMA_CG005998, isoform A [Clunio marinus]